MIHENKFQVKLYEIIKTIFDGFFCCKKKKKAP